MNIYWIFISLFLFCIYILFGLHLTAGLDSIYQIILTWIVYTILWITALNIFTIGYFWSVIMKKTGPYGIRGPIGDMGIRGMDGACNLDVSKLYCMKILNDYINTLYKAKTNTDLLNQESQTFPCNYVNEKIQTLSGSRQYNVIVADLSNDNKSIDNIINYLKSIWKTWFDLIYNATAVPGIWFTDEYGDEAGGSDYDWVGNNPFDEIKKYDVYYWGITRDFRPLKAELCRSDANRADSKFPIHHLPQSSDVQVQRLKVIQTNDYNYIGKTFTNDGNQDGSWWTPKTQTSGGETYYPVGDIMTIGSNNPKKKGKTIVGDVESGTSLTNGPDMKTILVAGDVVDPIDYKKSSDIYTHDDVQIKSPICPDGYTGIGDVSTSKLIDYKLNSFKCLPTECVEEIAPGPKHKEVRDTPLQWNRYWKWFDWVQFLPGYEYAWHNNINVLNSWDSKDKKDHEATYKNGYNVMRGSESEGPQVDRKSSPSWNLLRDWRTVDEDDERYGKPWYKIKKECMVKTPNRAFPPLPKIPASGIKDVEELHADLGIGWYGHPYKLDPKYSIFSFLNLVPEGMIVNQGTGHRFYIVHTEGFEINLFNILTFNNNSAKFDGSLQINFNKIDDPNNANIANNKKYANNSSVPTNVHHPGDRTPEPVVYDPPPKRVIITNLDKTNINQQWKIIFSPDKKFFKMRSMYDYTYLIITQEPSEGLVEFSSINVDNYASDPAFGDLDATELANRTNFSFISSFGTQLDIIARDDAGTTNQ